MRTFIVHTLGRYLAYRELRSRGVSRYIAARHVIMFRLDKRSARS